MIGLEKHSRKKSKNVQKNVENRILFINGSITFDIK